MSTIDKSASKEQINRISQQRSPQYKVDPAYYESKLGHRPPAFGSKLGHKTSDIDHANQSFSSNQVASTYGSSKAEKQDVKYKSNNRKLVKPEEPSTFKLGGQASQ